GVEAAAFRIVQESLTNVVRHARATRVRVRVRRTDDELEVQVDDDGQGPPGGDGRAAGRGITGMAERAHALGGTLEAGPRPGRGFRVRAPLPLVGGRGPAACSPTTRRWSGPGSGRCSTPRTTSSSWARPGTATRPWPWPGASGRTSCSWTSACPAPTA